MIEAERNDDAAYMITELAKFFPHQPFQRADDHQREGRAAACKELYEYPEDTVQEYLFRGI